MLLFPPAGSIVEPGSPASLNMRYKKDPPYAFDHTEDFCVTAPVSHRAFLLGSHQTSLVAWSRTDQADPSEIRRIIEAELVEFFFASAAKGDVHGFPFHIKDDGSQCLPTGIDKIGMGTNGKGSVLVIR